MSNQPNNAPGTNDAASSSNGYKSLGITFVILICVVVIVWLINQQIQVAAAKKAIAPLYPGGMSAVQVGPAVQPGPDKPAAPPPPPTPTPAAKVVPVLKDIKFLPSTAKTEKHTAPTKEEIAAAKAAGTQHAVIKTVRGDIVVDLYGADEPLTVANFVKLAKSGYYRSLTFHRVESELIQGGDPAGTGMGGPGYSIKLEVSPKLKHDPGALAMARTQAPDTAGSQFYITLCQMTQLDGQYAVFGKVTKGLDIAKSMAIGDKIVDVIVK